MIKLTPLRNKVPLAIALAIAAILATGQVSQAAVDERITVNASQDARNAEIENVAGVADEYAAQMGAGTIKLSGGNVKGLASVLTNAIAAKTPPANQADPKEPNRDANKADEIAESASRIAAGIIPNTSFKKKATIFALKLLQGSLGSIKKNKDVISSSAPNIFEDVAGSVMLTFVNNTTTDAKVDKKIFAYLKAQSALIAGGKNAKAVKTGLKEAFKNAAVANVRYEDGNLGVVIDPETDTRQG